MVDLDVKGGSGRQGWPASQTMQALQGALSNFISRYVYDIYIYISIIYIYVYICMIYIYIYIFTGVIIYIYIYNIYIYRGGEREREMYKQIDMRQKRGFI